jgi:hypothetical protein
MRPRSSRTDAAEEPMVEAAEAHPESEFAAADKPRAA